MHDLMPLPAVQKSVAFLYTKDEISERECEKKIPFKIIPQQIKYLGINLTKEVKEKEEEKLWPT